MNDSEGIEEARSTRFSYHGDEPTEGGVLSVATRAHREGDGSASAPFRDVRGTRGGRSRSRGATARYFGTRANGRDALHPPVRVSARGAEGELETVTPTVGTIRLTNAGEALLLTGDVKTTLRMECGRCLTPTDQPLEVEIEETFDLLSRNNAFNQDEVQAIDEDSPAAVINSNVLNLADLLRQNLLLAAPLQPLCREDCPGIPYSTGAPEGETPADAGVLVDNPLHRLAELLAAKRQREENAG